MPIVETWDETVPNGATRSIRLGDDDIKQFKRSVRERLRAGGHVWESSGIDAEAGRHACGGNPDGDANQFIIYEQDQTTAAVTVDTDDGGIQSVMFGDGAVAGANPYTLKTRILNAFDASFTNTLTAVTINASGVVTCSGELDVSGSLRRLDAKITIVGDTDYTVLATDFFIHHTPAAGMTRDVFLPAAASAAGRILIITNANTVGSTSRINPDGTELIDNATTLPLSQFDTAMIICNGTNWRTISISVV